MLSDPRWAAPDRGTDPERSQGQPISAGQSVFHVECAFNVWGPERLVEIINYYLV